jgi:hypothetical protein
MRNKLNTMVLVISLLFLPFFSEGKSTEEKSFIQEIKEKITREKDKQVEKSKNEVKNDKKENKTESIVKKENKNENKNKNDYKDTPGKRSRIQIVKDNISEEVNREEKKVEEQKEKHKNDHHYDRDKHYYYYHGYNHRPGYLGRHRNFYDVFPGYFINVRYTDYPYADNSDYIFSGLIYTDNSPEKIAFLYSSVEASYLGKDIRDTYGATAKISGNLYSLNFNYFYHRIFSSEESVSFYSINGGIYFALANFTLTPFLGAFYVETVDEVRLSYGANLQVFLPSNYILDLYNINSSYGSLNFNHLSGSLNYALYRFNIGLGFNYNNHAGVSFSGPLVKLSFWL